MVYKKYIKRNGKLYGPYIYHSKRVGDKVISEYRGNPNKPNYLKFVFIFVAVVLVAGLTYGIVFNKARMTGNVVGTLDANYEEAKKLGGTIRISLEKGEFIPASSKLIFATEDSNYEYDLSEVLEEKAVNGNYYLIDKDISGSGLGYGISGEIFYPDVEFSLEIYDFEETIEEPIVTETPDEEIPEEIIEESEEITEVEPVAEDEEQEIIVENEESVEEIEIAEETENSDEQEGEEAQETEPAEENAGITGNVVRFFNVIANFFLSLTPTGDVVSENGNEIVTGKVSANEPFVFEITEGKSVKILESSAPIEVHEEGNQITVTTDYYETDGKNKNLYVDLSDLNLELEENAKVSVFYDDKEIIDLGMLEKEGIVEETVVKSYSLLNDEEKQILIDEFGETEIKSKVNLFNGRYVVRYELGNRWIENSYDASFEESELKKLMEEDRVEWLRDIIAELSREKTGEQELENFEENYDL